MNKELQQYLFGHDIFDLDDFKLFIKYKENLATGNVKIIDKNDKRHLLIF